MYTRFRYVPNGTVFYLLFESKGTYIKKDEETATLLTSKNNRVFMEEVKLYPAERICVTKLKL